MKTSYGPHAHGPGEPTSMVGLCSHIHLCVQYPPQQLSLCCLHQLGTAAHPAMPSLPPQAGFQHPSTAAQLMRPAPLPVLPDCASRGWAHTGCISTVAHDHLMVQPTPVWRHVTQLQAKQRGSSCEVSRATAMPPLTVQPQPTVIPDP